MYMNDFCDKCIVILTKSEPTIDCHRSHYMYLYDLLLQLM